jgi:anti-sigma B factor antagonist
MSAGDHPGTGGESHVQITEKTVGAVTVLELNGWFVLGEPEEDFRLRIARLLEAKKTAILVNLAKVEFIDSSAVGALVRCLTSVMRAGGKLKGLHPSPTVNKILKITGVFALFEFFDDEAKAIASF